LGRRRGSWVCKTFCSSAVGRRIRETEFMECALGHSVDLQPERFDYRRPKRNVTFKTSPIFLRRRICTDLEARLDQLLLEGPLAKRSTCRLCDLLDDSF